MSVWTLSLQMFADVAGYGTGHGWHRSFAFHAEDQAEAERLAKSWARYQGFGANKVAVSPATDEESGPGWVSDEFVDRWRK